jgi:predicted transcriptional regulator
MDDEAVVVPDQDIECDEARESLKQEALASWSEYQETGRHLTGEEIRAWLKTWGSEAQAMLPECHGQSSPPTRKRTGVQSSF